MKTIRMDADGWIAVPERWPADGPGPVEWAASAAADAAGGADGDDPLRRWMAASLQAIAEDRPEGEARFVAFADDGDGVFFVTVLHDASIPELDPSDLVAASDPAATKRPAVEPVASPHLGDGLRSLRYVDTGAPDHDIVAILQYGWRSGGLDVVVVAASHDVALLGDLMPAIEELALSISVVED